MPLESKHHVESLHILQGVTVSDCHLCSWYCQHAGKYRIIFLSRCPQSKSSSSKLRGAFTSINEIMLTLGIILNFSVGSIDGFPYFYVSLVAVGIVALFEVTMEWLPDTPRSLLSRGYSDSAESALKLLRGSKYNTEGELTEIKESILARRKKGKRKSVWREFKNREVLVPFVYVLVVLFFAQGGGISAVESYATPIFSDAGVNNPRVTAIYAVGVASSLGNIASFFSVDVLGRKVLLVTSGVGMTLGSIMLGTHFYITRPSACPPVNSTLNAMVSEELCNSHFAPLAIVSLVLFRFFFFIGWGVLYTDHVRFHQRHISIYIERLPRPTL